MLDYYIMTKRYGGKSRSKRNKKGGFSFSGFADWVKSKTGLSTGSTASVQPPAGSSASVQPPASSTGSTASVQPPAGSSITGGGKRRKKTKKTKKTRK